ncbi:sedoheptulokinase-like [Haliotis asinina]|uniref:sedoheptulokinase-like n=1 Tax=Haliotis asinina TaxID=109174 RepID=UPI0035327CF6
MTLDRRLALGIDLGTSYVKLSLIDIVTEQQEFEVSLPSNAHVESDVGCVGFEQSPATILSILEECMLKLPSSQQMRVAGIAVTGQGTGLIMWPGGLGCDIHQETGQLTAGSCSNLYSWMDRRCTPEFLSSLPTPDSTIPIKVGMGWVTLQWILKHRPGLIQEKGYDCAGTIVDYVVAGLCNNKTSITSELLAYNFGYFNTRSLSWNTDILAQAGFPIHMLPSLVPSGTVVGHLSRPWGQIQEGVPVYVGTMDTQCAVHSVRPGKHDAVFYIGTSSQLGYVITDPDFDPSKRPPDTPPTLEYQPYFHGGLYASCVTIDENTIWKKLPQLALDAENTDLEIDPTLFGSYVQPSPSCSVRGITTDNITLGQFFKSLCFGVVDEISSRMDPKYLKERGITTIHTVGQVAASIPSIIERLRELYDVTIVVHDTECSSAVGAALVVK